MGKVRVGVICVGELGEVEAAQSKAIWVHGICSVAFFIEL